jgi:plastocyanin
MSSLVFIGSFFVFVSGVLQGPPAAGRPAAHGMASAHERIRTGTIEGQVGMPAKRRVAERYVGASAPTHTVQSVPAVVIVASIEGTASTRTMKMAQRDTAFSPAVLVVGPGTTVEFENGDPFFHNVFSYSPTKRFDLGRYPRGESRSVRFDEPGVIKVYCEVHDFMRAAIIVTEHPLYAIVEPDGRFSIPDVPAGRQKLVLMHPEQKDREVTVDVREGETTRVDIRFP